ncbi:hypothetical protein IMSAG025_01774 [Muribaculaceae bacterium]|nr:hypothetical protein IMSAG025_01774 [Muribaculaceae bacterium]
MSIAYGAFRYFRPFQSNGFAPFFICNSIGIHPKKVTTESEIFDDIYQYEYSEK